MRKSALLTYEQMKALPTKRLLAYKNRLYKVHEVGHIDYIDVQDYNKLFVTKESPEWKDAVSNAKSILSTREHIGS